MLQIKKKLYWLGRLAVSVCNVVIRFDDLREHGQDQGL